MYSFSKQHLYSPAEIRFSQGFPLAQAPPSAQYLHCVGYDFGSLSPHQQFDLLGDGQHLVQIGAWWLYVCAHLVRRCDIEGDPTNALPEFEFEDL